MRRWATMGWASVALAVAAPAGASASQEPAAQVADPFAAPPRLRPPTAEEKKDIDRLFRQAAWYQGRGANSLALESLAKLLPLIDATYGPAHPLVVLVRLSEADSLSQIGKFERAEQAFARLVPALQSAVTAGGRAVRGAVVQRAANLIEWGQLKEADALLTPLVQSAPPQADGLERATYDANFAWLRLRQGRYAEAEALARSALAAREKALKAEDPLLASVRANLAASLVGQARFEDAERLLASQRSRSAKDIGAARLQEAEGDLAFAQGRFVDAEKAFKQAAALFVDHAGYDAPASLIASAKLRLAMLGTRELPLDWNRVGETPIPQLSKRMCQSEPLDPLEYWETQVEAMRGSASATLECRRYALAFARRTFGETSPEFGHAAHELARALFKTGDSTEAEPLARQVAALRAERLGNRHPRTAESLALLSELAEAEGRPEEAVALARQVEAVGGATALLGLAQRAALLDGSGRFDDAAPLWEHAESKIGAAGQNLEILARIVSGSVFNRVMRGRCQDIPHAALAELAQKKRAVNPLMNLIYRSDPVDEALAQSLTCQGKWKEAAAIYANMANGQAGQVGRGYGWFRAAALLNARRALTLARHPSTALQAQDAAREAAFIAVERRYVQKFDGNKAVGKLRLVGGNGGADPLAIAFVARLKAAWALAVQHNDGAPPLDVATPASAESASVSLTNVERRALGWTAFTAAQDLGISAAAQSLLQSAARGAVKDPELAQLVRQQQAMTAEFQARDKALLSTGAIDRAKVAELDAAKAALDRVNAQIEARFPRYAELIRPGALDIRKAQQRLKPGEALLFIAPAWNDIYVFGLTPDRFTWRKARLSTAQLDEKVRQLRCLLDGASCRPGEDNERPFDRAVAYQIYKDVIAPVEPALSGAQQLYVVASGSLGGLPLGLLTTKAPNNEDKRDSGWLTDRYAITTLPSVSSLRAFSQAADRIYAAEFAGYGDPVLGPPAEASPEQPVTPIAARSAGGLVDAGTLRQLPSLPGTRRELTAMASALGAPPSALRLGPAATERTVRTDPALKDTRVIVFATHGLLPRELNGVAEPGLIFTPPQTASADDDGVLTASEAAGLDLSAQWVVLSACNTASADGRAGGESLSGLARAFLYAGAQGLLASHWQVSDDATALLTVEALRIARARPEFSRAQALQAAMRAVRTGTRLDGTKLEGWTPDWSDPWFWAPFVLIETGS